MLCIWSVYWLDHVSIYHNNHNHPFIYIYIYKDNAWIEGEIWNFHYGDQDKLDEFIPNVKDKKIILFIFDLMVIRVLSYFKGIE